MLPRTVAKWSVIPPASVAPSQAGTPRSVGWSDFHCTWLLLLNFMLRNSSWVDKISLQSAVTSAKGWSASGGQWWSMMFYVYVLRSLKNNKRYVGFTAKQPKERLREHNFGTSKWTRANKPFKLVYKEDFVSKTEAIKREKFLKSGQGRKHLDIIIPR